LSSDSEVVSFDEFKKAAEFCLLFHQLYHNHYDLDNFRFCSDSEVLFDKFYFEVGDMEPEYHCPFCDNQLQRVTFAKGSAGKTRLKFVDQSKFWQCPRCGNDEMVEVKFGNWD